MIIQIFNNSVYVIGTPRHEWTLKDDALFEAIREGITNLLTNEWDCVESQWWPDKDE